LRAPDARKLAGHRHVNRKGRVMLASHTVNPAPVFWQERRRV
jgi:hypothetical protein